MSITNTTVPFLPLATINTTINIPSIPPAFVWPTVKAMDRWHRFQDIFKVELVHRSFDEPEPIVEVGQEIHITTDFPLTEQETLEEYNEIITDRKICWTLKGYIVFYILTVPSPPDILRTARCIELFDNGSGGTELHNWISYAGIMCPVVITATGSTTEHLFNDFDEALLQFLTSP